MQLDWDFRISLINDIVQVRYCLNMFKVTPQLLPSLLYCRDIATYCMQIQSKVWTIYYIVRFLPTRYMQA